MYILMVTAWGDFDCPYDMPVCCSSDCDTIKNLKDVLNNYCANHPKVDMDVKMAEIFKCPNSGLYENLCEIVNEDIATKIYTKLEDICASSSVLIYGNNFEIQSVFEL